MFLSRWNCWKMKHFPIRRRSSATFRWELRLLEVKHEAGRPQNLNPIRVQMKLDVHRQAASLSPSNIRSDVQLFSLQDGRRNPICQAVCVCECVRVCGSLLRQMCVSGTSWETCRLQQLTVFDGRQLGCSCPPTQDRKSRRFSQSQISNIDYKITHLFRCYWSKGSFLICPFSFTENGARGARLVCYSVQLRLPGEDKHEERPKKYLWRSIKYFIFNIYETTLLNAYSYLLVVYFFPFLFHRRNCLKEKYLWRQNLNF